MSNLEVIGVGLGRTGTASLQAALNHLGYKTHHMKNIFTSHNNSRIWQQIVYGINVEVVLFFQAPLVGFVHNTSFFRII